MRFRIADLQVELACHEETMATAAPYACTPQGAADIEITPADYGTLPMQPPPQFPTARADYMCSGILFGRRLLAFGGISLHASAVVYDGRAYLFSAPSGTGKSTHADLWCQCFPGSYILNDDKPVIRIVDGSAYVYGTPWSGKHRRNCNARVPLGAICFLHRGEVDRLELAAKEDAITRLYVHVGQGHMALAKPQMDALLDTIERLVRSTPIYHLYCTPTPHAAQVAFQGMVTQSLYEKSPSDGDSDPNTDKGEQG